MLEYTRVHAPVCARYMRGYEQAGASMRESRVCASVCEYARESMRGYARVRTIMREYARVCASMREYAWVWASMRDYVFVYAQVCASIRECALWWENATAGGVLHYINGIICDV